MTGTIVLSTFIAVGGLAGAVAVIAKLRPERQSIIIDAAQGAVVLQSRVLEDLQDELTRVSEEQERLRRSQAELERQLEEVTSERDRLANQNLRLQRRVDGLQRRVQELEHHPSA